MEQRDDIVVVLVTIAGEKEAEKLAKQVLAEQLVACVNYTAVSSLFVWKGSLEKEAEQLLVMKTMRTSLPALEKLIVSIHPYDVPEIIALPVVSGHKPYLDWVAERIA